jgi:Pectate lyase superfamily protein
MMTRNGVSVGEQQRRSMLVAVATTGLSCLAVACGSPTPVHTVVPTATPTLGNRTFNVVTYGARGDDQTDNTRAFGDAIQAAEAAGGGVVYVPAGKFVFSASKTGTGGSVVIAGTAPITLQGAGRDQTFLIEAKANKGLLGVHIDHTVVEDLTLDTQTNGGGAALFVQANDTSLLNTTILGGPNHFAIYYAGPKGAKPLAPLYNTGNVVNNLILNELDCNDGFSWSFQENSSITNVTHAGSRLALYVDQSTTVTNYHYTPGAQQCGARNGFWLTPPANNITIVGFTSTGEGGKVGIIGPAGVGKVARNVTIQGLIMTASGYTLTIGDVSNLMLTGCNLGHNNIVINAQAIAQGTISHCTFGQMVRSGSASAQVKLSVVH